MVLKKKKKFKQRLQHIVRFDIAFDCKDDERDTNKPLICFVQAGSISDKKFLIGDLILSINDIKIETIADLDFEINKSDWGDEVLFEIKRLNKNEIIRIKTKSFLNYQKKHAVWPLDINLKNNLVTIEKKAFEYIKFDSEVDDGDILISINSKKISSTFDFLREQSNYKVGDKVDLKIKKKNNSTFKIINVKLISTFKAIQKSKTWCENYYLKKAAALMFREWEECDFGANHEDWLKRRDEVLQLETIAEKFADFNDLIVNWHNNDAKLISKLVKPEFNNINFKLNFFSLIFNPKIIKKLKSISFDKDCCFSFVLNGKTIGGDWNKKVPANIVNFEKLISVQDGKKELFIDINSQLTINNFFNLMIDKKKDINIKYLSNKHFWLFSKSTEKNALLSTTSFSYGIGFENILKNLESWFQIKYNFNKAKSKLAVEDWCKSFFLEYPDFNLESIKEIEKMHLDDEAEYHEEDYNSDYKDKIYISTTVSKKKINGKESFVVKINNLPNDEEIEDHTIEGKKLYLKIYIYDVTDLDENSYFKIKDNNENTDQYFLNNCHVVKTNDFSWSEGNNILVQTIELEVYGTRPNEIAFPYSKLQLPKFGKRKLSFRSFICTEDQKFDEDYGRFIFYDNPSFRAEEYFLDSFEEGFDDYNDYDHILSYSSSEISIEYKQPGYLEVNKRKYNDLKIALSFALNQDDNEDKKKILNTIKDSIRYGDFSSEGNINKILSLKKNYEKSLENKLQLDKILKELKSNSVIHERYEIIDFLLNLATKDETFNSKENKFIDTVSKELELNKEKYQEIKKQKTASIKFVDFGDEVEESVFGINKDMSKDEKLKVLRKEYSRWNALTNNSDKLIRKRAKEMRDLAASLRSQYNT